MNNSEPDNQIEYLHPVPGEDFDVATQDELDTMADDAAAELADEMESLRAAGPSSLFASELRPPR